MLDKEIEISIYKNLTKSKKMEFAKEVKNVPTEKDKNNGFMIRYFLKQVNNIQSKIIEVDKQQYLKFKDEPFYIKLDIKWKISGSKEEIIDINLNIINESEKILPGIKNLLENKLTEYSSFS